MNKVVVLFITLVFFACTPKDKLQRRAISDAKNMIEKMAKEPVNFDSDIRLEDIKPVYGSDSLCILFLKIKHQNLIGMDINQRIEFVHFGNRWFYHFPDEKDAPIYLTNEFFEKNKKGKIYENFKYDNAIYYRAALYLNKLSKEDSLLIPLRTGLWELDNYTDDSPKQTGSNYLLLRSCDGVGFCDNVSAGDWIPKKSEEQAELIVDKDEICFRILGGASLWLWNNSVCFIESSNGELYGPWPVSEKNKMFDKRIVPSKNKKDMYDKIRLLLEEEGIITVTFQHSLIMRGTQKYKFKMNLVGYKEASRFLK